MSKQKNHSESQRYENGQWHKESSGEQLPQNGSQNEQSSQEPEHESNNSSSGGESSQSAENHMGSSDDGTREYTPRYSSNHTFDVDPDRIPHPGDMEPYTPSGLGALNENVFVGLQNEDLYPDLAFSGEVPYEDKDGKLGEEDSVVRRDVELREEFPYG